MAHMAPDLSSLAYRVHELEEALQQCHEDKEALEAQNIYLAGRYHELRQQQREEESTSVSPSSLIRPPVLLEEVSPSPTPKELQHPGPLPPFMPTTTATLPDSGREGEGHSSLLSACPSAQPNSRQLPFHPPNATQSPLSVASESTVFDRDPFSILEVVSDVLVEKAYRWNLTSEKLFYGTRSSHQRLISHLVGTTDPKRAVVDLDHYRSFLHRCLADCQKQRRNMSGDTMDPATNETIDTVLDESPYQSNDFTAHQTQTHPHLARNSSGVSDTLLIQGVSNRGPHQPQTPYPTTSSLPILMSAPQCRTRLPSQQLIVLSPSSSANLSNMQSCYPQAQPRSWLPGLIWYRLKNQTAEFFREYRHIIAHPLTTLALIQPLWSRFDSLNANITITATLACGLLAVVIPRVRSRK
ncbi:hypothetical protein BJ085DRAFT_34495 [Dimargaris cristalligena]|uniref:Uncharacterized protein n=1 Tax=Dimargaris cristalligena TaxID=215637 RepID=A0A4Q0A288_9FUNG|nr:hypothetical protein BJ085DRAFT_34495 [Dimargaris cristalligena]|eukprot:RKP39442.1 hypothetical protein BJ085DRAFT_34495 [Dimargaris cristalligena]